MSEQRDKYGMTAGERRMWRQLNAMWWVVFATLLITVAALIVKIMSMFG